MSFYFNRVVKEVYWERCGLSEQRSDQSEFSFELEELSLKFAWMGKDEKNPTRNSETSSREGN
jgi:hypothetical protein